MVMFTQYLLPRGQKRVVRIDMDSDVETKALAIQGEGLVFECEVLSNYIQVSLTITDPDHGDLDIRICKNGPEVPDTVKSLIMDFDLEAWKVRRKAILLGAIDDDVDEGPSD
jgi:hypothetical protein